VVGVILSLFCVITVCDLSLLEILLETAGSVALSVCRCVWSSRWETIFGKHLHFTCFEGLLFLFHFGVIMHAGHRV
jgi:hypothetical protein